MKPVEQRFWAKVRKSFLKDGCWPWQAHCNDDGYGKIKIDGKVISAHRLSWEIHFGPIPEGMKVLHKCDNPPCVRPDHLFLGTDLDNHKDCVTKGRDFHIYGSQHWAAKLTEAIVKECRRLSKTQTARSLAKKYNISESIMGQVIKGKRWKHVL